ncbi:MAG: DUF533 domain-containing protein [Pseudomonadota bacterium]
MGMKRMITKLALAFAAKKGVEMFRNAGGIEGLRSAMNGTDRRAGGDRVGGAREGQADGLGNILGSLGVAGATDGREGGLAGQDVSTGRNFGGPMGASLGGLLGSLSQSIGQGGSPDRMHRLSEVNDSEDDPMTMATGRAVIRAMVHVARADGHIDPDERRALEEVLSDANETELSMVKDAMKEAVDAQSVADATPMSARRDVYAAALLVAGDASAQDQAYLNDLAKGLALSPADIDALHGAMNSRPSAA